MNRKVLTIMVVAVLVATAIAVPLALIGISNNTKNSDALTISYSENDGIEVLRIKGDLQMDKLIKANCMDTYQLCEWLEENVTDGHDLPYPPNDFGCSAFTTVHDGKGFICRNFDFYGPFEKMMAVEFEPSKGGYKSIGMIPKVFLSNNMDDGEKEVLANPCYKAAPYSVLDGMNEKGLFGALLAIGEASLESGNERVWPIVGDPRNIIMMNIALRIVLDRAANVQEAVEILGNFNTSGVYGLGGIHLYLADAHGSAVTYEIDNQKHRFTYEPAITNHFIHDVDMEELLKKDLDYLFETDWSDYRLSLILHKIYAREPVVGENPWTVDECKDVLKDVRATLKPERLEITAWSLVADPFNGKIYVWQLERFDRAPVVFDFKDWSRSNPDVQ